MTRAEEETGFTHNAGGESDVASNLDLFLCKIRGPWGEVV